MAVIQFARTAAAGGILVTWEALGNADSGAPFKLPCSCDLTFQLAGTFGSATCTLQGSNDGATWHAMTQKGSTDSVGHGGTVEMAYTAAHTHSSNETPLFVRPLTAGGTGTDLDVVLVAFPRYGQTGY